MNPAEMFNTMNGNRNSNVDKESPLYAICSVPIRNHQTKKNGKVLFAMQF